MIASVIIPTRNKRPLLARTLAALEAQEGGLEAWEIVVVDDASTDGTAELLAASAARLGPRLRIVRCDANVGRAAARNRGAAAATGRWLLFLDDDILAGPGLLAAHLARLAAGDGVGTIGRVRTAPEIVDAPHFHYLDTRGAAKVAGEAVPARYFVTQNAAVPRESFWAVGGFDERFSAYGFEDAELAFRLADRCGLRFVAVPGPAPWHLHHHTLAQVLAKKQECGRWALPLLARLHPKRILEMRLHWVIDCGRRQPPPAIAAFRAWARGRGPASLQARMEAWPVQDGFRPVCPRLYARGLDLLVLAAFRRGLEESENART